MSAAVVADASAAVLDSAAASAGLVITLTGSIFGMDFSAIMAGFTGALIAQTFVASKVPDDMTRFQVYLRAFLQLVAAGLLAGLLSPLAEAIAHGMLPAKVGVQALHLGAAGIIGMVAPVAVPLIRKIASKWMGET